MVLRSATMVYPTANLHNIIAVHTLCRVSLKTLALTLTHQNDKKKSTFSETLIVEISLQT